MLQLLLTGDVGVSFTREHGWRFVDCRQLLERIPSADDDELPGEPLIVEVAPPRRQRRAGRPRGNYWPEERLRPHGTATAYKRHVKRGEEPCDPCIDAIRIYDRDRKRRQRIEAQKVDGQRPLLASVPTDCTVEVDDEQVAS